MMNIVLMGDIHTTFFLNLIRATCSLPKSRVYVLTHEIGLSKYILIPSNLRCYEGLSVDNLLSRLKTLDCQKKLNLVMALDALQYGKFLRILNNDNTSKILIFSGSDTRFSRRRYPGWQQVLNSALSSANAFGFVSKQHLHECVHLLGEKPSFLLPFGYVTTEMLSNLDCINQLSSIVANQWNCEKALLLINEKEVISELYNKINSFKKNLRDNFHFYILTPNGKTIGHPRYDISFVDKEELLEIFTCANIVATISFEYETELKVVNDLVMYKKPIFVHFHPVNLVFEHGSPILLFSDIESLSRDINILAQSEFLPSEYFDSYLFIHSQESLKNKIFNILINFQLYQNLKFYEDVSFDSNCWEIAVFCYFSDIEPHRSSARPMRLRAMSHYIDASLPTLKIYGHPKTIRRRIKFLETILLTGCHKVSLIYEETTTTFFKITTDSLSDKMKLLELVQDFQLNYGVYIRDMHPAYLDYYEIVGEDRSVPMYENMIFELGLKARIAKQIYVPSLGFVDEAIKRAVVSKHYQNKFIELSPGIDCKILSTNVQYISGNAKDIRIVYTGGLGGFYNFKKFIEAFKICECLPIQLDMYIRRAELENSKHIYGDLEAVKNINILEGQFTDLAKNENYDLGLCIFESDLYMKMAAPVKLFDYLSLNIPVVVGLNTHAGKVVSDGDVGFVVPNTVQDIVRLLIEISQNRELLAQKQSNIIKFVEYNKWQNRVELIFNGLRG